MTQYRYHNIIISTYSCNKFSALQRKTFYKSVELENEKQTN